MNIYLSENRFLLFVLCSSFFYTFISIADLPWTLYLLSLMACAAVLYLYLILNLDIILMRKYRMINVLALIYSVSTLISVYYNGEHSYYTFLTFALNLAIFPFIEIQHEKRHLLFFCKVIFFWLGIFLFANDTLMVIMPGRFYGDGIHKTFLMGNKFSASYNHMIFLLTICILWGKSPRVRKCLPFLFAAVCLICHYMDCNTAVIGTAVFFLIVHAPKKMLRLLGQKKTVLALIVLCALFIYFDSIIQIPFVKHLVTEILRRDVTLTGRKQIYEIIPKVIRAHPWIGYGSSADVISRYTGAFNVQNGFFDLVVQNGIPSALLYIITLVSLIRRESSWEWRCLLGLIYGFLIMSTVEITYNTTLILFGILLFTGIDRNREEPVTIIEWKR